MLPVAILAGGLAQRLRPFTETIPKALVEVTGRPFIFHQLDYLKAQGLEEVVICTGYLGEMIEAAIGDGSAFGLNVSYAPDGPILLGTGGAIKQALPLLSQQFFALYGDSFLPIEFRPVVQAFFDSQKPALMTILKNDNRWDKSNVLFRNGELIEYNKQAPRPEMKFIDYGLGVLDNSSFETYKAGEPFDLAEIYHSLSLKGQLAGYEAHHRFYEIGSHAGLKETEDYFSRKGKL